MRIAHREGKIVGTGCITGNFETVDIETDLAPWDLLRNWKIRDGALVPQKANARVALVSVWDVPCGISTYSGYLWEHLKTYASEWAIFAEREEGYTDSPGVYRCWRRGEPLTELVGRLKEYDPDIIYVQHEYGYFPKASHWMSFMGAMQGRNVVVTLHSVYKHPDKTVVEAAIPRIIVHTQSARAILKDEKKVPGEVTVIPHGCPSLKIGRYWNPYGSAHTILQFGFGFPYKGIDNALHVVSRLKPDYPDVFYTCLMSERSVGQVSAYRNELMTLAEELSIVDSVALISGFQSDETLDAYLRTNKVVLFPYRENGEHTVYGCSGAARVAMAADVPVIASNVPLFDDLSGVVPRFSTVEGWREALSFEFSNPGQGLAAQRQFLQENSWVNVANRYHETAISA